MKKKDRSLCIIPLIFALLLICTACNSTPEPSVTPVYADSSPSPAILPDLSPIPGNEETDVVLFLTYKDAFIVTNEENQILSYDNENFSSTMEIFEQKDSDALEPEVFYAKLPYSGHYVCERMNELAKLEQSFFSVGAIIPGSGFRNYFTVKSSGILQRVEYDESGELCITGDIGAALEITTAMYGGELEKEGFVRLTLVSAHEEINLKVQGNTLSFSGLEPQPVMLSYGGIAPMRQEVLELIYGSGTIELSAGVDGKIDVTVDYPKT